MAFTIITLTSNDNNDINKHIDKAMIIMTSANTWTIITLTINDNNGIDKHIDNNNIDKIMIIMTNTLTIKTLTKQ